MIQRLAPQTLIAVLAAGLMLVQALDTIYPNPSSAPQACLTTDTASQDTARIRASFQASGLKLHDASYWKPLYNN